MSTYTEFHNKAGENLQIRNHPGHDDDRVSLQEVKLSNDNNEYYGTFYGRIQAKESLITGGLSVEGSFVQKSGQFRTSPDDGLSGFWIGDRSMHSILNDLQVSSELCVLDLQQQITDNKDDIHGLSTILSTQVQNFETTFIDKDKKSYAKLSSSNLILTDTVKKDPETYEKAKYYMSLEQGTIVLKPIY